MTTLIADLAIRKRRCLSAVWILWLVALAVFWLWAYLLRCGSHLGPYQIKGWRRALLLILLPILGVAFWLLIYPPKEFVNPRFKAAEFQWPSECPARQYRRGDDLPRACVRALTPIPKQVTDEYWFVDRAKGRRMFYRIGNDAASFSCVINGDTCHITNIYNNTYVIRNGGERCAGSNCL